MVNRLRSAAALATGLTGMTVALGGCGGFGVTTYHDDRNYEVPAGFEGLDLRVDASDVEIVGADTDKISVHERLSWSKGLKPTTGHRREGDTLLLEYRCPDVFSVGFNKCEVRYRIQMPRKMAAKVRADAGDIRIRGIGGAIRADADSGNITATDLRGGTVDATVDAGNITVAGAGSVRARADSGNIELLGLRGGRAVASADSGNVLVAFAEDRPPAFVRAATDTGNVIIRVPATTPYDLISNTESGAPRVTDLTISPTSPHKIEARTDTGTITVSAT